MQASMQAEEALNNNNPMGDINGWDRQENTGSNKNNRSNGSSRKGCDDQLFGDIEDITDKPVGTTNLGGGKP